VEKTKNRERYTEKKNAALHPLVSARVAEKDVKTWKNPVAKGGGKPYAPLPEERCTGESNEKKSSGPQNGTKHYPGSGGERKESSPLASRKIKGKKWDKCPGK